MQVIDSPPFTGLQPGGSQGLLDLPGSPRVSQGLLGLPGAPRGFQGLLVLQGTPGAPRSSWVSQGLPGAPRGSWGSQGLLGLPGALGAPRGSWGAPGPHGVRWGPPPQPPQPLHPLLQSPGQSGEERGAAPGWRLLPCSMALQKLFLFSPSKSFPPKTQQC